MIKNIVLDVGRVLAAWEPEDAMRRMGFDEETVRAVADATVRTPDWDEMDRGALDDEEILARFIARDPSVSKEIRQFVEHVGTAIHRFDYTMDWIARMKENGYRVYILSNYAARTFEQTKEELSFLSLADGAVFSFEIRKIKPEPEIYQTLLSNYGLKPEECLFLDDRPENAEGARALGMNAICFQGYGQAVREMETTYGVVF